MKNLTKKFLKGKDGVTALEYGLIAGLIAVAIAGTVSTLGGDLNSVFNQVIAKLPVAAAGNGG
jgi:pilus assembly protein Flp/PilA